MHDRSTSLAVTTWRYASSCSAPSLRRHSQRISDNIISKKIRHLSRFDKAQTCPNRKMTYICTANEGDSLPHSAEIKNITPHLFLAIPLGKKRRIQTFVWLERERREDLRCLPTFILPFGTRQLPQLSGSGPHDLLFRSLTPYIFILFSPLWKSSTKTIT